MGETSNGMGTSDPRKELEEKHRRLMNETAAVIERFDRYMETSDRSEVAVAKALGKSQSYLNQWRHMKLDISDYRLARFNEAVDRFLRREVAREKTRRKTYVETPIGKEIMAVLHRCYIRGDMGLVYGHPGIGKTMAARQFVHENPDCILLTANYGWSMRSVLMELIDMMGMTKYGSPYVATKRISEALVGTDRMIIVDEAHFLKLNSLEIIRSIHDYAEVGVVYIGQPELNKRMLGIDEEFYAQIFSRIAVRVNLGDPSYEDVKAICHSKGITDTKVIQFLYNHAQDKYGSIRTLVHMVDLALDMAEMDQVPVTVSLLKEAGWSHLI